MQYVSTVGYVEERRCNFQFSGQKIDQFTFCKKCVALKVTQISGDANWDIKHYSAAALAKQLESVFFSTTILI